MSSGSGHVKILVTPEQGQENQEQVENITSLVFKTLSQDGTTGIGIRKGGQWNTLFGQGVKFKRIEVFLDKKYSLNFLISPEQGQERQQAVENTDAAVLERLSQDGKTGVGYRKDGQWSRFDQAVKFKELYIEIAAPPVPGKDDKFGHRMIYATVNGGQEYFIREDNLNADNRVKTGGDVHSFDGNNKDGYTVDDNGKVRINFCATDGTDYDGGNKSFKHPDLAKRGFIWKNSDWKNCEFTVYVKPGSIISEGSKKDNDITLGLRTGRHTDDLGDRGICEGFSYKVRINSKKRAWEFRKEQWHNSGYAGRGWSQDDSIAKMEGKWIGYKFIIYSIGGGKHVKTELWLDENNNNSWKRKDTNEDKGGWVEKDDNEVGKDKCDASEDQIGTWGGPWALLRWDGPSVEFRDVVVREIDPSRPLTQ